MVRRVWGGQGKHSSFSLFQISHSAYLATEPDNLKVCRESLDHLVLPASRVHLIHWRAEHQRKNSCGKCCISCGKLQPY